jgi:hypothetical protein
MSCPEWWTCRRRRRNAAVFFGDLVPGAGIGGAARASAPLTANNSTFTGYLQPQSITTSVAQGSMLAARWGRGQRKIPRRPLRLSRWVLGEVSGPWRVNLRCCGVDVVGVHLVGTEERGQAGVHLGAIGR